MASFTCSTHQWLSSVTVLGVPQCTQPAFSDLSGQIDASQLIAPTALTFGAVKSSSAGSNQFATGIDTAGAVTYAQPAFSNLSGVISASQLIAPGASTFGAVKSSSAPTNQFATGIDTSGVVTYAQPAFSNLSGSIDASQLIAPGATTFGAVKSSSAPSNQFATGIDTSGSVTYAQPSFSNLSGQIAASQLIAPTLTTLGGVKAIADVPSQWLKSLGTDGVFATQQPEGPDILHGAVTVNTTAELAALSYSYAPVVIRLGVSAAGDASPLAFIRSNSACSLNAGAGDGGSQVPTSDSKCRLAVFPAKVEVSQFGVFPGTANNTQLQYAVNAAAAAHLPLVFDKGTGVTDPSSTSNCYQATAQITFPSAYVAGNTWDLANPFTMRSASGALHSTCIKSTANAIAQFANSTLGVTTNREANAGLLIEGIDFIGPQDYSNPACAIGTDNQRMPVIRNVAFYGYVGYSTSATNPYGGCGVFVWSYQTGGTFQGKVENADFGQQKFQTLTGSNIVFSFDDHAKYAVRSGVVIAGPSATTGKASDWRVVDSRFECVLQTAIVVAPYDTWSSGSGSSQNIHSARNYFYGKCAHSMETGVFSAVVDASNMTLRTTASTYLYSGSQLTASTTGSPMILRAPDANGIYRAAYISGTSGGDGRTIALGTALPFTPSVGGIYELGYDDPTIQADLPNNPMGVGRAFYFAQGTGFELHSQNDYFENVLLAVLSGSGTGCILATPQVACAAPNSQNNITFTDSVIAVNRGWTGMYASDGSAFIPKGLLTLETVPWGGVYTAAIRQNMIVGDPSAMSAVNPLMYLVRNATGGDRAPGDTVVMSNNGGGSDRNEVVDPAAGNADYKCFIVTAPAGAPSGITFGDGQPMTLALGGQFAKVTIYSATSTAAGVGDEVIAQAPAGGHNGTGQTVAPAAVTAQQLSKSCGKLLGSATGGQANAGVSVRIFTK